MLHLQEIKAGIKPGVELVAVSKYHPAEAIQQAYDQGQRVFGESRVQELQAKRLALPQDIRWHFIGHLQPNKVKYIAPYISLIHAVDSLKLLAEIEKQAAKVQRTIPCLLELHLAQEETKYGLTPNECTALLEAGEWRQMTHVKLCGLMCMASNTDDEQRVSEDFAAIATVYGDILELCPDLRGFDTLSMGMSGDWPLAVEQGSNMVRIGTAIFGEREY